MHLDELPMIIFTTIAQMSVGAFVILGCIQLAGRLRGVRNEAIDRVTNAGMYAAGPLLVLGFFAALFHLYYAFHALYTMLHFQSSWLSREILFGVLYGAFGLAFALTQWFGWLSRKVRDVLAVLTALSGIALVVSMVGVYASLPTVPAWNSWFTWVLFFGSAAFTGSLAVALALAATWQQQHKRSVGKQGGIRGFLSAGLFPAGELPNEVGELTARSIRTLTAVSVIAGAVMLVAYPFHMAQLGLGTAAQQQVAQNMMHNGYLAIRLVSLALTVVLVVLAARGNALANKTPTRKLVTLLTICLVLAVATELLGRGLHYEGLVRDGINTVFG